MSFKKAFKKLTKKVQKVFKTVADPLGVTGDKLYGKKDSYSQGAFKGVKSGIDTLTGKAALEKAMKAMAAGSEEQGTLDDELKKKQQMELEQAALFQSALLFSLSSSQPRGGQLLSGQGGVEGGANLAYKTILGG